MDHHPCRQSRNVLTPKTGPYDAFVLRPPLSKGFSPPQLPVTQVEPNSISRLGRPAKRAPGDPRLKIGRCLGVPDRLADDTGPWESLDPCQAAVLGLCHPQGGEVETLQGVLPGKGREAGEGWRNRFRVSQGTTAVITEGEEVENWVQPYTGAVAAESKQAVRNLRPLKIQ